MLSGGGSRRTNNSNENAAWPQRKRGVQPWIAQRRHDRSRRDEMKEQPDVRTRGTAQFNQSLKLTGEDASSLALTS